MSGPAWWQRGAIYQIYPRSFADSDGDGVGDLRGIVAHLDYLADLGVAALWLSPIYPSPMVDFGYDVADYCDVDPTFGTLADLDRLIEGCHARGIRVILDWVPNHTSDRHPWFTASRSSREDPKRDWYVWRDGRDGGPPNDWRSDFAAVGPAWTFEERTGQWYLHSYTPQQPDLNWDNPAVEAAMHDVLRFWLDRGVDGFRIDALQRLAKDPLLRDNVGAARRHDQDWDTTHDRVRGIRRVVDEYPDRMIVGEVYLLDLHRVVSYLNSGDQLHLAHNFVFSQLPWDAEAFRTSIDDFEALAAETAWPAWFLANHDLPRVASRFDQDGQGPARARAVALLLYALRGTPFVYQGEELGLPDAEIPPDRVVDVDGRDPQRAPLPWRPPSLTGPAAGFSTGEPWLPLVANAEVLCVERQAADSRSTLTLLRRLAALRARTPTLQTGAQRSLEAGAGVLAWLREDEGERLLAAVNFAAVLAPLRLPAELPRRATLLISTDPDRADGVDLNGFALGPSEAVLLRL
ncbi:MAG TPA: alpha-amylase family glycosyl hydrolase [Actinomycetes bacterium]|jgi:alpha-glucosidase|nr:alpha-amylase family glycosyl hydrolase [Actinomycetes bacterium]